MAVPYVSSTSVLQYAAAVAGALLFCIAVIAKRLRTPKSDEGPSSARSRLSIVGIAVQGASFFVACGAPVHFSTPSDSMRSLTMSALVFGFGAAGAVLFDRSAKALGANWSVVARTRVEHQLVQDGPFARMRHPIYFSMLLLLATLGLGLGHTLGLLAAIPLFVVGTVIRIREEERLLREQFGGAYEAYAERTPAFIPFIGW